MHTEAWQALNHSRIEAQTEMDERTNTELRVQMNTLRHELGSNLQNTETLASDLAELRQERLVRESAFENDNL